MKPNICLLVTQYELAGAQKNAITQARYFYHCGYDVTLAFFYDKYGNLDKLIKTEPYKIINLRAKKTDQENHINFISTLMACYRFYRYLRKNQIDILETLTHYSNIIGIFIAWLAKIPVRISSQRNTLPGFPKWFLRLDALIVNWSLTNKMICVSETTRAFCIHKEGMNPKKLLVIPNGIDITHYDRPDLRMRRDQNRALIGIPQSAKVIISIGRLHHQKGYPFLIEAAKLICQQIPEAIFLVVGEGEMKDELIRLIKIKELSAQFKLLGSRTDIPQLLALADLFVLSSLYEGMPNVMLEAMAARLPVVATCVDGSKEIIVDKLTGILVPVANVDSLVKAIVGLLKDPGRMKKLSQEGYKRIQMDFSEDQMCKKYEEELIGSYEKSLHRSQSIVN